MAEFFDQLMRVISGIIAFSLIIFIAAMAYSFASHAEYVAAVIKWSIITAIGGGFLMCGLVFAYLGIKK